MPYWRWRFNWRPLEENVKIGDFKPFVAVKKKKSPASREAGQPKKTASGFRSGLIKNRTLGIY
jgi:hypothetical protein